MSQETLESTQAVEDATGAVNTEATNSEEGRGETTVPPQKLVPVAESIKYRREAQQAEGRLQQIEQQLGQLQQQMQARQDELATAEAKADELRHQVLVGENRLAAERLLAQCGVADMDAAARMLGDYVNIEEADAGTIAHGVEQLLLDKPLLRRELAQPSLPAGTAAPRSNQASLSAQLASVAHKAATSGDRRDVIQYLRLRRQGARVPPPSVPLLLSFGVCA